MGVGLCAFKVKNLGLKCLCCYQSRPGKFYYYFFSTFAFPRFWFWLISWSCSFLPVLVSSRLCPAPWTLHLVSSFSDSHPPPVLQIISPDSLGSDGEEHQLCRHVQQNYREIISSMPLGIYSFITNLSPIRSFSVHLAKLLPLSLVLCPVAHMIFSKWLKLHLKARWDNHRELPAQPHYEITIWVHIVASFLAI